MTTVRHGFDPTILEVPLDCIHPISTIRSIVLETSKFRTILSSIRELGVIEPLAVHPSRDREGHYDLLDGRMRLEALKQLGHEKARCMVSLDDEGFTFNRQITRIASVQEHRMIRAALAKGASEERIAQVLDIDVKRVREKAHLLDGIAPEAARLLKDRQVVPAVFAVLRKMKPFRQIEAAEMMIAANKFTKTYAEMILVTTRSDALIDKAKPKKQEEVSPEDISRMEAEMERLQQDSMTVEDTMGETMLSLVVAKGFITRLLRNENIHAHLRQYHEDLLTSLTTTLESIAADNRASERE
ncbi:ParB-like chromosome segregation protein Spo0J [Paraburkholderia bannensis]|uniref:ParB-like chromosome segregation protein Spo0J n=1 Tax=Paraburkholderia bannensis TaxID=765414 RepID=A0A7W9TTV4_9BURK|nr:MULTISPECIES: plasmid partitioning protein RepB C-terminal domain-containing protein [Paraburkholderia]MBB3256227.1 ParB-like chromosome segregation protein Spo0J [Paraburkholderia sp. WP4_3_2]MBB6101227.1 ParB-like chromosome segregation protein Spo0J [Paraburkholderia bannensis]